MNGGLRGDAANPPYDLPPHILDLFPDSFEDSDWGKFQRGGKSDPSATSQTWWAALRRARMSPPIGKEGHTHGPHPKTCLDYQFPSYSIPNGGLPTRGCRRSVGIAAKGDRPSFIESPHRLPGCRRDTSCDQSGLHRDEAQDWDVEPVICFSGQASRMKRSLAARTVRPSLRSARPTSARFVSSRLHPA